MYAGECTGNEVYKFFALTDGAVTSSMIEIPYKKLHKNINELSRK